jgi:hypothetical protein
MHKYPELDDKWLPGIPHTPRRFPSLNLPAKTQVEKGITFFYPFILEIHSRIRFSPQSFMDWHQCGMCK